MASMIEDFHFRRVSIALQRDPVAYIEQAEIGPDYARKLAIALECQCCFWYKLGKYAFSRNSIKMPPGAGYVVQTKQKKIRSQ